MALSLSVETPHGWEATYWKAAVARIDWLTRTSEIFVYGWKDAAARVVGKQFIVRGYTWNDADFPFTNGLENHTQVAYDKLKTLAEWTGTIDV